MGLEHGVRSIASQLTIHQDLSALCSLQEKVSARSCPVIHGVIVPEEWAAPHTGCDLENVILINQRAYDFGAGPEDIDLRRQIPSEVFKVGCRRVTEHRSEYRVIRVVGRAYDQPRSAPMLADEADNLGL